MECSSGVLVDFNDGSGWGYKVVREENNEKLFDKLLGMILSILTTLPVGTRLVFTGGNEVKEMTLDSKMSSRWAHECIFNFLQGCADECLDSRGYVGRVMVTVLRGSGPDKITLVQDKLN